MVTVAALHPADAFEAQLAAQIVGADAHAKDCLRLAIQPGLQPEDVRRCRAQAGMMMRHMRSGVRTLQRRQAEREKADAAMQPAAMERAGYWFREMSAPAETAQPAALTEAECYAAIHPDRAARIRAEGGLPARLDFALPEAAVVAPIVNGTSPILRALDQYTRDAPDRHATSPRNASCYNRSPACLTTCHTVSCHHTMRRKYRNPANGWRAGRRLSNRCRAVYSFGQ